MRREKIRRQFRYQSSLRDFDQPLFHHSQQMQAGSLILYLALLTENIFDLVQTETLRSQETRSADRLQRLGEDFRFQ